MGLKLRIHEWMAARFSWVQYPDYRKYQRVKRVDQIPMNSREVGWFLFAVFWGGVIALAIFGNLI